MCGGPEKTPSITYDQQAKEYDKRAGLSELLCQSIVTSIANLATLSEENQILEVACGTGQIGGLLDDLPSYYYGFDMSAGMLEQFKNKYPRLQGETVLADARARWPIKNNVVNVIFASRAIHWIDIAHILDEAYRVSARHKAYLLIGRVESNVDSWEAKLRKHLHQLLQNNSLTPLDGEEHLNQLRTAMLKRGAAVIKPIEVGRWQSNRSAGSSIEDWAGKQGLAGTLPNVSLKTSILNDLRQWAEHHLVSASGIERRYMIYGFKLF